MTPQRLFVAGLFNFSLAALAVVGAAMQLFDNLLPFDFNIFNPVDWFDLAERYGLEQWVVAHRWVAGVGALVSLLFIGFASGVLMMMPANWGFRLTREPRELRRPRGLTPANARKRVGAGKGGAVSCNSGERRAIKKKR